jgi:small subunit ribosomal protein S20
LANISSAQKTTRASKRKEQKNRTIKSATKTYITRTDKLLAGADKESAKTAVKETASILDRAAKKKVLHPNTVSRYKSRLSRKLNKMSGTAPEKAAKPAAKKTAAKKKTAK